MRFTASSEQLRFFKMEGSLELEDLLTEEEALSLRASINRIKIRTPGYPEENLFRSLPLISSLARKRGWGQIAYELIHKKPLRIAYDKFFPSQPTFTEILDTHSCGLILELATRKGIFFKQLPQINNSAGSCYFLLILTAKHLPDHINPIIL